MEFQKICTFLSACYVPARILLVIMAELLFFLFMMLYMADAIAVTYRNVRDSVSDRLESAMKNNRKENAFSYMFLKRKLDSMGVTYYSNGRMTPLAYLSFRLASPAIGIAAAVVAGAVLGMAASILWWLVPDLYIKKRNDRDNEKMLWSIMSVYDVVLLQITSGEYITSILIDAYRVASHPRLKNALIDLTSDIISTNDLNRAVDAFGDKFDNENIHNLVVLIKQLSETGTTPDMLSDIRRRLITLQESYNRYERDRVTRLGNACAIAVFAAVMAVIAYTCMAELAGASYLLM